MPLKSNFNAVQKPAPDVLREAVKNNDIEAVRRFLRQGADPNQGRINGSTPLMLAAGKGHTGAARLLIDGGALLDEKNKSGSTALIMAAAFNREETARLLVDRGAALDIKNSIWMTALDYAKAYQYTSIIHLLEKAPEIRRCIAEEKICAVAAEKERLRYKHVSAKQEWLKEKARRRPRP